MNHNIILYSFRRCPYAIRARLAIAYSGITIELREVALRSKPQQLIDVSTKATVPVLVDTDGNVIAESLDIMMWAIEKNDPQNWYKSITQSQQRVTKELIEYNDGEFKYYLDRYKYADRYPENSSLFYRQQAEKFLKILEKKLQENGNLIGKKMTLADFAILPFIRQFAAIDNIWFEQSAYVNLKAWLSKFLESELFFITMKKYSIWTIDDPISYFP